MPKFLQTLYSCSVIFISLTLFVACSSSDDEEFDYQDQSYDGGGYQEDSYNPADYGWRPGIVKIEVLLKQSAEFHEKTYHEYTKELKTQTDIVWAYELKADSSQKIWVIEDLSIYMPPGTDEERYDAMESAPYMNLDNGGEPVISGALNYELDYQSYTPNSVGHDFLDKKISGSGVVDQIELEHFKPSLYGIGYQFDLLLNAEVKQTGRTIASEVKGGSGTEIDESAEKSPSFDFEFYPTPNATLNDYPYLYEYNELTDKTLLAGQTKFHLDWLAYLQKIAARDVQVIIKEHTGAITEKWKDKLVVEYKYTADNKLIPFIGYFESIVATPDSNLMIIRVTVTAD